MLRSLALVSCFAGSACSTMPPFSVDEELFEHHADAAPPPNRQDAGPTPRDGGAPRDAAVSPDAALPDAGEDYDYRCSLYGISAWCASEVPTSSPCGEAELGEVCFNLPGRGLAQMLECQNGLLGQVWAPTYQARCAYNCEVDLPSSSFFSLAVEDCAQRVALPCREGSSGTTQDTVDAIVRSATVECGFSGVRHHAGISLNAQGCPDFFYSSQPRVPEAQQRCLAQRLEQLRLDCGAECSLISSP